MKLCTSLYGLDLSFVGYIQLVIRSRRFKLSRVSMTLPSVFARFIPAATERGGNSDNDACYGSVIPPNFSEAPPQLRISLSHPDTDRPKQDEQSHGLLGIPRTIQQYSKTWMSFRRYWVVRRLRSSVIRNGFGRNVLPLS